MRKNLEAISIFQKRRAKLKELMGDGSTLILSSPQEKIRNGSVHYPFRQDSSLYYLTGFEEPETIFMFRPGKNPESILFVRKKDSSREIWDGFRFGPEEAQRIFQTEACYPIDEFSSLAPQLLKDSTQLYYTHFKNPEVDAKVDTALKQQRTLLGRSGLGLLPLYDADALCGELRLFKLDSDLENHRRACEITAEAHIEIMKYAKPGMSERELHGYFLYQIMKRGCAREGYGSIFASAGNACILHYVFNDRVIKKGDFLLIDAAGEYNYFTSDITRTYPIGDKYSTRQREIYEAVLDVQKNLISQVKVGKPFKEFQEFAAQELTTKILDLGFLSGRKEDIIASGEYKRFYPHLIGHFLGMDVHDIGSYFTRSGEPRLIQPGMVFTIEPGFYIQENDDQAPKEYRGIGVRIEDNILVTTNGYEVLTKKCPKEISEVEAILGSSF